MPFVIPEDVQTTPRGRLSPKRRLQVWERGKGVCVICQQPIDGVREGWMVEHVRALELGGDDDLANMAPAHERCGRLKTRDDHARTARAKRQKIRHIGASVSAHSLPTSRTAGLKRKVDGTVVLRATGEQVVPNHRNAAPANSVVMGTKNATGDDAQGRGRVDTSRSRSENGSRTKLRRSISMKTAKIPPSASEPRLSCAANDVLPALPQSFSFMFDEDPVLPSKDKKQYRMMQLAFMAEIKPKDVIEAMWVRDILDLLWQAKRYRRWRKHILALTDFDASKTLIETILRELREDPATAEAHKVCEAQLVALGRLNGTQSVPYPESEERVGYDITTASLPAPVFLLTIPVIDRVERLIVNLDCRRDTLLREIERRRTKLAEGLRAASERWIDAEAHEPGSSRTKPVEV